MSSLSKKYILIVIAVIAVGFVLLLQNGSTNYPTRPDATVALNYFQNEFKPKYKRKECIVRIDFSYLGDLNENYSVLMSEEFRWYLLTYEPKAIAYSSTIPAGSRKKIRSIFNSPMNATGGLRLAGP